MSEIASTDDDELLPCPFCGGEAEVIEIEDGENAGGSCVSCTRCQASSNVEFEFKENFVSNWNRRQAAAPELLEALKGVVSAWTEQFERQGHFAPLWCLRARAAISKATGGDHA